VLNLEDAGGGLIPIRASSLIIAPTTSAGYMPDPGGSNAYIDGRLGIGMQATEGYSLDAKYNIRTNGQLVSWQDTPISKAPMIVNSNILVQNLNADRVDGYEARDILNSIGDSVGYGVVEGLEVSPNGPNGVIVHEGWILIEDVGMVNVPTSNFSSGINQGMYCIICIAGKDGTANSKTYKIGQVVFHESATGFPSITDAALSDVNPVLVAKIDYTTGSTLDNKIIQERKMQKIIANDESLSFLKSDNVNIVSDSGYEATDRFVMKKNGNTSIFSVSNIYSPSSGTDNIKKKTNIYPEKIEFQEIDPMDNSVTTTYEVDKVSITAWNDADTKKHVHHYDAPFQIEQNGYRLFPSTEKSVLDRSRFRIYVNGIRKKLGVDYIEDSVMTIAVWFNYPLDELNDVIILDYDE
jgi:hypothetical protein